MFALPDDYTFKKDFHTFLNMGNNEKFSKNLFWEGSKFMENTDF